MAWFETGGGGALSETVLWTNPSPTSNQSTATVSLNDNISNYKYIKIYWKNIASGSIMGNLIVDINEFMNWIGSANHCLGFPGYYTSSNSTFYFRPVYYATDTTVSIGGCRQYGATGLQPSRCIITQISGLK
jgi:hypothetical protein